jgi:epoxyqueuosine reductase
MKIKTAIIPFSCFEDIKQDVKNFALREDLNNFQKWIANEKYILNPAFDFEPQSIIAAAVPFEVWHAVFIYNGKRYVSEIDKWAPFEEVRKFIFKDNNYHFFYDYWLPQKRIAARSGLAKYGRNNICFVDGFGSLFILFTFISDMPAPKEYIWQEVVNMPECDGCILCQINCPTGAILPDRFLIDNQKCLSLLNEFGTEPFPDFVPKTAHHRTMDCSRCQDICPRNKGLFEKVNNTIEFSQEETGLILSGTNFEALPAELAEKIELCDMKGYYPSLPRNLSAWFENVNS